MEAKIPHPDRKPIIGNLHQIAGKTPIQKLIGLSKMQGPIFEMKILNNKLIIISGLSLIDELCKNEKNLYKKIYGPVEKMRVVGGDGLFTAHNHEPNWQKAHNILMPGFGLNAMKGYFPMMLDIANQLIKKWDKAVSTQEQLNVSDDMTRLTLDTIGLCGFDYRLDSFASDKLHPFLYHLHTVLVETLDSLYRLPITNAINFPSKIKIKKSVKAINAIVDNLIAERKANPSTEKKNDFLNLMLEGVDKETGEKLSDENMRYQINTFLVAGHETTSALLTFSLYYIIKNPEVLRKAYAEVDRVLGGDLKVKPEYKNCIELKYLNQILKEALRLWPPVPAFRVAPKEDIILGGKYKIKKDQALVLLTPTLHRQTEVWGENSDLFDPENFSDENEAKRPDNCYKPFGNGMRACIGRQFTMIEAQLVLAMILQKYKLIDCNNYELKIKETLTLKPDNFFIKLKLREPSDRTIHEVQKSNSAPATKSKVAEKREYHGTPLLILFGSNMGLAEGLASELLDSAKQRGYKAQLSALDNWKNELPKEGALVVICSTYNGTPPDNARIFFDSIHTTTQNLKGANYAVFGCGNTDWKTFQHVPRAIDKKLKEFGAMQLLPGGEGNVNADFESQYESWLSGFWQAISAKFSLANNAEAEVENKIKMISVEGLGIKEFHDKGKSFSLTVLQNKELQNFGASKRSTKHIEVALPENVKYKAGDHLAVYPANSEALVQRVLNRFQLKGDVLVKLKKENDFSTTLPIDKNISIKDLLTHYVELQDVATRKQVKYLQKVTACPPERKRLDQLMVEDAKVFNEYVHEPRRSVLDLLEEFPASEITFEDFILLMPPLRPRYYSISSGPSAAKQMCSVTVSVLNVPARNGKGNYKGVCSNYLKDVGEGTKVTGYIKDAGEVFRLPQKNETPIIMIGPGTGFAPFRGFLQERVALKSKGEKLGKAILFFGARNENQDFIYKEEIKKFEEEGVVQVITAFSRPDSGTKAYVQDKINEFGKEVIEILKSNGRIYICGDGSKMEPDVRKALNKLLRENAVFENSSVDGVDQLIEAGRYALDVWASG